MLSSSERSPMVLWVVTLAITNLFIGYVAFGLGKGLNNAELARVRADRDLIQESLTQCLGR